jgi:hypothetical protein
MKLIIGTALGVVALGVGVALNASGFKAKRLRAGSVSGCAV